MKHLIVLLNLQTLYKETKIQNKLDCVCGKDKRLPEWSSLICDIVSKLNIKTFTNL